MDRTKLFLGALAALALSGCGDTALEQSLFGAGTGAVGATVIGTDPGRGALVGAVANVAYCQRYPSRC